MMALFILLTVAFWQDCFPIIVEAVEYPRLAEQAQLSGKIQVVLELNDDGTVNRVLKSSGHGLLVDYSTRALKKWRFHGNCISRNASSNVVEVNGDFQLRDVPRTSSKVAFVYIYPNRFVVISDPPHWNP